MIEENDVGLFGFPLSTEPEDLEKFTALVTLFQEKTGIVKSCRPGVLCSVTTATVQNFIRRRNTFS